MALATVLAKQRRSGLSAFRDQLRVAHNELSRACDGFRIYRKHLLPDFVLLNYTLDAIEQTHAVQLLIDSPVPRAAVSNARAAYEAALYALLLVADPASYHLNGALARACELVENEHLLSRRAAADAKLGLTSPTPQSTPEQVLEAEGTYWEGETPGAKGLCLGALKQVRADGRWKRHWSGDNGWKDVAASIEAKTGSSPGFREMADALYGLESIHSHPRPRSGARATQVDAAGRLAFGPRNTDAELAAGLAFAASELAREAINRRKTLIT